MRWPARGVFLTLSLSGLQTDAFYGRPLLLLPPHFTVKINIIRQIE